MFLATLLVAGTTLSGCGGHDETASAGDSGDDEDGVHLTLIPTSDTSVSSDRFDIPGAVEGKSIFYGTYRVGFEGKATIWDGDNSREVYLLFQVPERQPIEVGSAAFIKPDSNLSIVTLDENFGFAHSSWIAKRGTLTIVEYQRYRDVKIRFGLEMVPVQEMGGPDTGARGSFILEGTFQMDLTND